MLTELLLCPEYLNYCRSLSVCEDDANDLLSEVISKVAEYPEKYEKAHKNGYFKQYIFRTIYNMFITEIKKEKVFKEGMNEDSTYIDEKTLSLIERQISKDSIKKKLLSKLRYSNCGRRNSDTTPQCCQGKQE
jgi:DNA-directed RNA polymerase specialized sigma24 family protein